MATEQSLEETLESSPLVYVKESKKVDGKEVKLFGFVHDTYRDFFLARYFAEEINYDRMSVRDAWNNYFSRNAQSHEAQVFLHESILTQMAGLLNSYKRKELFQELSLSYFKRKEEKVNDDEFDPETYSFLDLCDDVDKVILEGWNLFKLKHKNKEFKLNLDWLGGINLVYEIAQELNLNQEEIDQKFSAEAGFIVAHGYFFMFSGLAQTYIFHLLPAAQKKQLTNDILSSTSEELGNNFFFDLEATAYICKILDNSPDMPRMDDLEFEMDDDRIYKRRKDEYSFDIPPEELARHLRSNNDTLSLLTGLFSNIETDTHVKFYVSKVLINLGKSLLAWDTLLDLLDWRIQENYDDEPPVPEAVMDTIYDACLQSEELWAKILSVPRTKEQQYLFSIMRKLAEKGHHPSKLFLKIFPKKEKELRKEFAQYGLKIELCDYLSDFFIFDDKKW